MCNDEISLGNELNDYDENKTHTQKKIWVNNDNNKSEQSKSVFFGIRVCVCVCIVCFDYDCFKLI